MKALLLIGLLISSAHAAPKFRHNDNVGIQNVLKTFPDITTNDVSFYRCELVRFSVTSYKLQSQKKDPGCQYGYSISKQDSAHCPMVPNNIFLCEDSLFKFAE